MAACSCWLKKFLLDCNLWGGVRGVDKTIRSRQQRCVLVFLSISEKRVQLWPLGSRNAAGNGQQTRGDKKCVVASQRYALLRKSGAVKVWPALPGEYKAAAFKFEMALRFNILFFLFRGASFSFFLSFFLSVFFCAFGSPLLYYRCCLMHLVSTACISRTSPLHGIRSNAIVFIYSLFCRALSLSLSRMAVLVFRLIVCFTFPISRLFICLFIFEQFYGFSTIKSCSISSLYLKL